MNAPGRPKEREDVTQDKEAHDQSPGRMPVIFVAHGSPLLLDDAGWVEELRGWAQRMPRPKSILMLSAHWEQRPITLAATRTVPLVYDFYGFPAKYYEVKYPAPGAPELAARVRELLARTQPLAEATERGLDHGAYVPLVDRKSTRLNSSHLVISYAVFCLKKKQNDCEDPLFDLRLML